MSYLLGRLGQVTWPLSPFPQPLGHVPRHLGEPQLLRRLPARLSHHDHSISVHHDRLAPAVLANRISHFVNRRWSDSASIAHCPINYVHAISPEPSRSALSRSR